MVAKPPGYIGSKAIRDADVLAICEARHDQRNHKRHLMPTPDEALAIYPAKVVKAKLEKLFKRGFLSGATDDPWLTPSGREYLSRARNAAISAEATE